MEHFDDVLILDVFFYNSTLLHGFALKLSLIWFFRANNTEIVFRLYLVFQFLRLILNKFAQFIC